MMIKLIIILICTYGIGYWFGKYGYYLDYKEMEEGDLFETDL